MDYPEYSYPPGLIVRAAWDLLLLRPRDLRQDAKACIEHIRAPLNVLGKENIPQRGNFVLTINHYHRPGLGAQWIVLAVTALVPLHMRWVITGEIMYQEKWYRAVGSRASRIFLKRLAKLYGLTTMPPMPPRPRDMEARAASVRAILSYVKQEPDPVLGISPEGHDPPGAVLTRPAAGFGRFGLLLSRAGMRFIPVAGYEANGILHLHFGPAYELGIRNDAPANARDERAMRVIMEKIACLLPVHLRGEFN